MCGIGGIVYTSKQKFNKPFFNIIGIANDSRGGDSCGIFIDQKVEYGYDKSKLYSNFFYGSSLLEETKECKLAFLHCRKASVGGVGVKAEKAQPVVIEEDGEIKYCLMHNGTIHNYEELAKKYIPEINIKGMTDSQVMARIFYYKGYDALAEYNGAAVFAIADYRNEPKCLFWKGESKETYGSKEATDERPFWFYQSSTSFVFSSIAIHLDAVFGDENVYTITGNSLVQLKNGELTVLKQYDRSAMQQTKKYVYNNTSNKTYNHGSGYGYGHANGNTFYMYNNSLGEFMCGSAKLHGKRFCSPSGTCYDYSFDSSLFRWIWFYQGVLLINAECYNLIEDIRKEFAKNDKKYNSPAEFAKDFPEIICYFSYLPVKTSSQEKYFEVNEALLWVPYTGKVHNVMGSYFIKECENGDVKSTTYGNANDSFERFKEFSEKYYLDKIYFINLINRDYNVSIQLDDTGEI